MLRTGFSVPRDPEALEHALEGLVALDAYLIGKYDLPHVTQIGVEYREEDLEDWRNAIEVIGEGWGDCEDLAGYHAGWLRTRGEAARVILERTGPKTLHALVLREDGTIEDPSVWLGMEPIRW